MATHCLEEKAFLLLPHKPGDIPINEGPALAGLHTGRDLFLLTKVALGHSASLILSGDAQRAGQKASPASNTCLLTILDTRPVVFPA